MTYFPIISILSKPTKVRNPYRLAASRQLHSRILLLVVLPESRFQRLQQARVVSSQSLDICNIALAAESLACHWRHHPPATTFESCIRQLWTQLFGKAIPTDLSRRRRFDERSNGCLFRCHDSSVFCPKLYVGGRLVGCLEVRSFGGSMLERSPRRSPETRGVDQVLVLLTRSFQYCCMLNKWQATITVITVV